MIKILIDGVFFQLNNTGIARVWQTLLSEIARTKKFCIYFLDRGNAPVIDNIYYIKFPKYHTYNPEIDSLMIQKVCEDFKINVFSSTYYTTPTKTSSLLTVYDMIPEVLNYNLSNSIWIEKQKAIAYAHKYICISNNTKKDLTRFHPEIPEHRIDVCHLGVDNNNFYPRKFIDVTNFKKKYGINKQYFVLIGNRGERGHYKNCSIFFDSIYSLNKFDADILCIGGSANLEDYITTNQPQNINCRQIYLCDDELATAYTGAIALVYPTLYEGFGLPVIEAMASGCPVITTHGGSLAEVASDAAYIIDGHSIYDIQKAVYNIQNTKLQHLLRQKGLINACKFNWNEFTDAFINSIIKIYIENQNYPNTHFINK